MFKNIAEVITKTQKGEHKLRAECVELEPGHYTVRFNDDSEW